MSGVTHGQQDIEKIETQFWDAFDNKNDSLIVKYGEILRQYHQENKIEINSSICDIYFGLALAYRELGKYIESNANSIHLLNKSEIVCGRNGYEKSKQLITDNYR